jgi:hypothetical protein
VLYHHFPGGKQALAVAAVQATTAHIHASLDRLIGQQADPLPVLAGWVLYEEENRISEARRGPLGRAFDGTRAIDRPIQDGVNSIDSQTGSILGFCLCLHHLQFAAQAATQCLMNCINPGQPRLPRCRPATAYIGCTRCRCLPALSP